MRHPRVSPVDHERMNHGDDREARASGGTEIFQMPPGRVKLTAGTVGFFHLALVRDFTDDRWQYLAIIFAWPKRQHKAF